MPIIKTVYLSIILITFAFAGLAIKVLLKKNSEFPETEVSRNKELKKRGITCAKHEDMMHHGRQKKDQSCTHC